MKSSAPTPKTDITCSNPRCSQKITITVEQKIELLEENFLKYGKISLIYCCKACQDEHLKKLSESKFVRKGTLKNHEYALIVHDADVTKRPKEKEFHIVTGTVTEQRARCLYEKLMSVSPRKNRKYLTSREVQTFLLNDLPENLRAKDKSIILAAYDTMNKTKELFPIDILIGRSNKRSRYIEVIKRFL